MTSVGNDIDLQCRLDTRLGSPLVWRREDGTPIPSEKTILAGNILRIRRVNASDSGRYVCSDGSRFQYLDLTITGESYQSFTIGLLSLLESFIFYTLFEFIF